MHCGDTPQRLRRSRHMPHDPNPISFPWETLDAIIGGQSAIDVPRVHCRTFKEAEDFVECYGFDWHQPAHRAEVDEIRQEALSFIRQELLIESNPPIHEDVATCEDVRVLLLWASGEERDDRQRWACAMLRVMHTIAHCKSHLNEWFKDQIREQILARIRPHIYTSANGMTLGRGFGAIELERFEVKHGKPLRSAVMKLLHKVENVAEDIFDRIGFRFVTTERYDALLVVRYLRENNVVMFANIKPSRSRNTLIDLAWIKEETHRLEEERRAGRVSQHEQLEFIRKSCRSQAFPQATALPEINQHSSVNYHSLQFTCRQMIRIRDPRLGPVEGVLADLSSGSSFPPVSSATGPVRAPATRRQFSFFFPFEVQVLDQQSYEISRSGLASHAEYKRRQRETVRRRVLGELVSSEPS